MIDKCLDNLPATLFHTYRVKDQTSVFVHVNKLKRTPVDKPEIKEEAGKKRKDNAGTVHVIRDINQVTVPFDNIICPNCNNDTSILSCPDCGCVKCYLKTGDPLVRSTNKNEQPTYSFTPPLRSAINVTNIGTFTVRGSQIYPQTNIGTVLTATTTSIRLSSARVKP